mgnify:CR=1 FL=1
MELNGSVLTLQTLLMINEDELGVIDSEFNLLNPEEAIEAVELLINTIRVIEGETRVMDNDNYIKLCN